jgi:hypothetical protein
VRQYGVKSGDFDSENSTLSLLCAALGGIRFEWAGDDSSKADGFIVLANGGEVEVDVARDLSEHFMMRVAEATKQDGVIKLSPGTGSWEAHFDSRTRIKDLKKNAQGIVDDVVASGRPLGPHNQVIIDHLNDGMWIDVVQRVCDAPDQLGFRVHELFNEENSWIDTSPDAIGHYAQEYIAGAGEPRSSRHRAAKFENLAVRAQKNGRQAHFALVAASPKNIGVWHALTQLKLGAVWDYELPKDHLTLPDGIHGFWVLYPDFLITVAYPNDRGWIRCPS